MHKNIIFLLTVILITACKQSAAQKTEMTAKVDSVPAFNADSAFVYVKTQVDFGPRIPDSKAHDKCVEYMSQALSRFGATVVLQKSDQKLFDGTKVKSVNVIGSFNPKAENRILFLAHWDSRPWADNDPDPKNHKKPVMAANDGASGVGVLLEIARQMGRKAPSVGIDLLFVDTEDCGESGSSNEDSWCLGTQYWAKNPHVAGYKARYAVLLDMVGAPEAVFYREQGSDYYAAGVVDQIWSKASELGYSSLFINQKGGAITDDHVYINKVAGIPCVDIIHFDPNSTNGFGLYWHTTFDTIDRVSKTTLNAVGNTLLHVIYAEK